MINTALISQNARKFKDKDNLGGVPKIKKNRDIHRVFSVLDDLDDICSGRADPS